MARKKLLSEGEVRQFMKLANLGPLSENYFSNDPLDEQELEGEEDALALDDLGGEEEIAMDAEEDLEDPGAELGSEDPEATLARVVQVVADELGVEVDVEGAGEEGGEDELEVGAELEEPLPGGGEEELELGAEEEIPGNMEAYQENQELNEMGDPASMALLMKALVPILGPVSAKALAAVLTAGGLAAAGAAAHPGRSVELPDEGEEEMALGGEEEMVAEVARRVAERLMANKQKDTVADQLAERIFARLTEK
tara:strand:+ start:1886 stop:2647 length:762 start_codon:yes stop_codon:yes gene_type:complete